MKHIAFTVKSTSAFRFERASFDPSVLHRGFRFEQEIVGSRRYNGINSFKKIIVGVTSLPRQVAYQHLFATCITGHETSSTGLKRVIQLAERKLADPDLLWSLYKEKGQNVLRYLRETYEVRHMEALRRVFSFKEWDDTRGKVLTHQFALSISYEDGADLWHPYLNNLDTNRYANHPVLVLGR